MTTATKRSYRVPAQAVEVEFQIKKSRFIARAAFAANRASAIAQLDAARCDFPDARHHCWAYLIGDPYSPATVAMSDAGEPSGTAGKPILNVLQHKEIGDVMLIVSRYFGGIKLGAGGLVRAYSSAAQQAMEALPTRARRALISLRVSGDYALEQGLRHWLDVHKGSVTDVDYGNDVRFEVALEEQDRKAFCEFITASRARILER